MNAVKPRRRDISAALTRDAVLDAARDLFVNKGFSATSIGEIASAAESSNGAIYHHFDDKQGIFAELFRVTQLGILESALAAMPDGARGWDRIELATDAFLRGYVDDDAARTLLAQAVGVLGWERVREIDDVAALPVVRGVLEAAIEDGDARPVPVHAAAEIVFATYCSAVLLIAHSPDPKEEAERARVVLHHLLGGLRMPAEH